MTQLLDLSSLVQTSRIVLCGGTGGVGKTTTAAAIGMLAAKAGLRTLVLTIDPARRLADAMGLDGLDARPQAVPGQPGLHAMMLDPGSSLDELIARHATTPESAQAFLKSPYYQQVSRTVAGSREFVAMEKIHELAGHPDYDLLVVDTPPSSQALDFIDAPARLLELLDGSGLGLLLRANSIANRLTFGLAGRSQRQFARLFEQLTGHRLMMDLNLFFDAYGDIIDGFRNRAKRLQALLRDPQSTFVLIMTPASDVAAMADQYAERLRAADIRITGAIFNQFIDPPLDIDPNALRESAGRRGISNDLLARSLACHNEWQLRAEHDKSVVESWLNASSLPCRTVPRLAANVSSQADLERIVTALSGAD